MEDGFRVQTVAIEGFKGFTIRKEIDFRGRHVFLLGENGNGKSSIIEAIRWGLFGSTRRQNEIVANQGYARRCRVEITLMREGKQWNLRRTLIRGVSGGSDAVLTDELGQDQPIREIMPQLDSLDAGEGTHIIFAPQATPLRRQPEDLSSFARTVLNHLGLAAPQSLLSQIDNFLAEQELAEKNLGEKLNDARSRIDNQIAYLESQRGRILNSQPWEGDLPPSSAQSEGKARAIIQEITGKPPEGSLSGVSLTALIDYAEEALQGKRNQNQGELEGRLADVKKRLNTLGLFYTRQENIEKHQSEVQDFQSKLAAILAGMSLEELRNSVKEEQAKADAAALRQRIVEDSISLLHHEEVESVFCPICGTEHRRHDLESKLQQTSSQQSTDTSSRVSRLETLLKQAEGFGRDIQKLKGELTSLTKNRDTFRNILNTDDSKELAEPVKTDKIKALMDSHSTHKSSIEVQIENQEGWFNDKQAKLSKMRDEGRFHQIQIDLVSLHQSRNRFGQVQRRYEEFVSFGESVRTIQQAIKSCLSERLEGEIPNLSEDLSRVFSALTRHPWYDRLTIAKDILPKLELRVTSSQDPTSSHPTGVLNGQAESALDLVPYFTFSQANDTPTEVYLVLLDDPTRAFDEEHIEILVERLAELGRSVQLMVASQETNRFRKLLPEKFDTGSYVVVEPARWSYHDGPELGVEYT